MTGRVFPLSSLEEPRLPPSHYRDAVRTGPLPYQASQGVPPGSHEGQMSLFDEEEVD